MEDRTLIKHYFISGRVQGVGFRAFVRRLARGLNLRGWVRNLADGRVEARVEGSSLDDFERGLPNGPGQVTDIEARVGEGPLSAAFEIREDGP